MSAMSDEHRELLEEKLAEEGRWYHRGPSWENEPETEPGEDDQGVQWDSGEEEDDEDVEDDDGEDLPNYFVADF